MATNTTLAPAKSGSAVLSKVLLSTKHGRNNVSSVKRRAWVCTGAAPAVDAADYATYPLAVGDVVLRTDNSTPYICTVKPAAATAATLVALIA
jgi:hypothetical protein